MALTCRVAVASAFSVSPAVRAVMLPGFCVVARSVARNCVLSKAACSPSVHTTASAVRPFNAAHVLSATTAIPRGSSTMARTPFTAVAAARLNDATLPPGTGGIAIAAKVMSGTRTSSPYRALPVTISGPSMRRCGLPMKWYSSGSLKSGFCGTGNLEAAPTSAANDSCLPVAKCVTLPSFVRSSLLGNPSCVAAAVTSISRAAAPARRSG